jgi:hypothetical protein
MVVFGMSNVVQAKWDCVGTGADVRCQETDTATAYNSLRECLRGANNADPIPPDPPGSPCKEDPRYVMRNFAALNFWSIGTVLNLALPLSTALGAIVCGAFLMYGAYMYIQSGGEAKKVTDSMHTITYAIVGLVIILVAFMIVRTLLIITKTNTFGF